jgi:outer membrane protein
MKKIGLLFSLIVSGTAFAAEVALVDMQRAVQATEAGKKAKDEMESEVAKKRKEFEKKEADLRKTAEDIDRKKAVLSSEALTKKQADLQVETVKLQRDMAQTQLELQKREKNLVEPILKKMRDSIAKVAKDKGYKMVLENNPAVLYMESAVDITDEVLKEYNTTK